MFDNELRVFVFDQATFDSPWYEDRDGILYIDAPNEIEGPDNQITSALNRLYQKYGQVDELDLKRLGLVVIPDCLKRFDPLDGYYHA